MSLYGFTLPQLNLSNYTTVIIIFQLNIKEIDDGYQEIYLFSDASTNAPPLVSGYTAFEHGPGKKNTTSVRYAFYAEVLISQFTSTTFVVRFGAHGNYDDNWAISNFELQLVLSKDEANIKSLAWVKNAITYIY